MIQFNRYKNSFPFPEFVQGIWWLENGPIAQELPLISDGYPELMISLSGETSIGIGTDFHRIESASIVGIIDQQARFTLGANSICVSVKLMPWALPIFIQDRASLLKNGAVALSCFTKSNVLSNLFDMDTLGPIESVIENFIFPMLHEVIDMNQNVSPVLPLSISEVFRNIQQLNPDLKTELAGSKRYYEKLYQEYVGLSPMRYKRLLKIKKASLLLLEEDESGISGISGALGYFDLSHFNKDFQRFTGVTPTQYAKTLLATPMHNNATYRSQYQYS
ncbi:MAG: helix-turn-helix domain-containing protein [Bacteroidota bacterium]